MTKSKLLKLLAATAITESQRDVGVKNAEAIIDALGRVARDALAADGEFTIPGVVRLGIVERKARIARNPATGQPVDVPARRVVKAKVLPGFAAWALREGGE